MAAREPDQTAIERALARPVSDTAKAGWGFTNRTDFVTLGSGERVVLQRYRNPGDAGYRLRVMRGSGLDPGIGDIVAGRLRSEMAWQTGR